MTFKIGDIVRLKCGGPEMIIGSMFSPGSPENSTAICYWFDKNLINQKVGFPVDILEEVPYLTSPGSLTGKLNV